MRMLLIAVALVAMTVPATAGETGGKGLDLAPQGVLKDGRKFTFDKSAHRFIIRQGSNEVALFSGRVQLKNGQVVQAAQGKLKVLGKKKVKKKKKKVRTKRLRPPKKK